MSNTAGTTVVDFSASAAIEIVNDALLTLNKGNVAYDKSKVVYKKGAGDKQYQATFKPTLPAGKYTLLVVYDKDKSAQLEFTVK